MTNSSNIPYVSDRTETELRALWEGFRAMEPASFARWVELHRDLKPRDVDFESQQYKLFADEYKSRQIMIPNYLRTYIFPEIFDHTQTLEQIEHNYVISNTSDDMRLYYNRYLDNEDFWEGK
jgi:hypothetical protein